MLIYTNIYYHMYCTYFRVQQHGKLEPVPHVSSVGERHTDTVRHVLDASILPKRAETFGTDFIRTERIRTASRSRPPIWRSLSRQQTRIPVWFRLIRFADRNRKRYPILLSSPISLDTKADRFGEWKEQKPLLENLFYLFFLIWSEIERNGRLR
jgi:hypothetical protein